MSKKNIENKEKIENNIFKNPTFIPSFKNALRGIGLVFKSERNIKIQTVFGILVFILGIFFRITFQEWVSIAITIFLVLLTETINTAIEGTVDMITNEYSEKAKDVKDISAGAVLLSSISSVVVGIIIFLPKILIILK